MKRGHFNPLLSRLFMSLLTRGFGTRSEVVALLGTSTAYIERSHLTNRLFNGRQVRKTLAFSKDILASTGLQQSGKMVTTAWCALTRARACPSRMSRCENGYLVPRPWLPG